MAAETQTEMYLIIYRDSADVREPKVFIGWYESAKYAVLAFSLYLCQTVPETPYHDVDFNHTIEQIINNFNLYHQNIQISAIYSNPNMVASASVDFTEMPEL